MLTGSPLEMAGPKGHFPSPKERILARETSAKPPRRDTLRGTRPSSAGMPAVSAKVGDCHSQGASGATGTQSDSEPWSGPWGGAGPRRKRSPGAQGAGAALSPRVQCRAHAGSSCADRAVRMEVRTAGKAKPRTVFATCRNLHLFFRNSIRETGPPTAVKQSFRKDCQ